MLYIFIFKYIYSSFKNRNSSFEIQFYLIEHPIETSNHPCFFRSETINLHILQSRFQFKCRCFASYPTLHNGITTQTPQSGAILKFAPSFKQSVIHPSIVPICNRDFQTPKHPSICSAFKSNPT